MELWSCLCILTCVSNVTFKSVYQLLLNILFKYLFWLVKSITVFWKCTNTWNMKYKYLQSTRSFCEWEYVLVASVCMCVGGWLCVHAYIYTQVCKCFFFKKWINTKCYFRLDERERSMIPNELFDWSLYQQTRGQAETS